MCEISILRCPNSKQKLVKINDQMVSSEDGKYCYPVIDGIFKLRPDDAIDKGIKETDDRANLVRSFYESYGWSKNSKGIYNDTNLFVDQFPLSRDFTHWCNLNLTKHLSKSGAYLLDAGSGAIPHKEYLDFHKGYEKRLCIDFSFDALLKAKSKLGNEGMYVLGDLTNLPLLDNVVSDAVAMHVVYHIPDDKQACAFEELNRVLLPGRKAIVVYQWEYSPLARRIGKVCEILEKFFGERKHITDVKTKDKPSLYFYPHSVQWFESMDWSFDYRLFPFRVIEQGMMKKYFNDHWCWTILVKVLKTIQIVFPHFTGKYGAYPAIIIEKKGNIGVA